MNEAAIRFLNRYDEPFRSIIIFVYEFNHANADIIDTFQLILSCIAFIVNFFHLFILSRKIMRSSSINVLMIGLAMNDMLCFATDVSNHMSSILPYDYEECDPPASYIYVLFTSSKNYFYEIFRRVSPWIGVIMAFIRFLISLCPFNNTIGKMANPSFAVWSLIVCFLVSTLMEADSYFLNGIIVFSTWVPKKRCGFPKNYSQPVYIRDNYGYIDSYDYMKKVFDRIKVVFKHLPVVILPVLTIGLVILLKKIKISKQRLNAKDTTYQTTRLVTIMTSCLVITEGFTGLVGATFTLLADGSALIIISAGLNMFFHLLYSMNSMAHCFIAMLLSSQYKRCARDALPCMRVFGRKSKTATALMSIPSTNSRLDRERLS